MFSKLNVKLYLPVFIKKYGRILKALTGFYYDFIRYKKYSAWHGDISDVDVRNYHLVKIYHALEKSMSYKNRDKSYGWYTAKLLLSTLIKSKKNQILAMHDYLAVNTLIDFINLPENKDDPRAISILQELHKNDLFDRKKSEKSILPFTINDFKKGILIEPEKFFFSRYSLREFSDENVTADVVKRAINLSIKTPSVCNRQPWHFYHTSSRAVIDTALSFQSGNKGFGNKVSNLMVITSDLKAFMPGEEHYQHWIDGGLVSMSLIYAFHSLGVASCCLNWSQSPSFDKQLRKSLNIRNNHTVIMMLAFGFPEEENLVCASVRRPLESFISELEAK